MQYLNSKGLQDGFGRVVFDMLLAKRASLVGASEGGGTLVDQVYEKGDPTSSIGVAAEPES